MIGMITEFLVKKCVKDHENTEDVHVRTAYGVLTSITGIVCNILLFAGKLAVGLIINSVSVMADAFNNLSDAASSIIGFIGVKMAEKPADKEHSYGHGRIEYIAALIVSFLVIEVGFTFLKSAIEKIRQPEDLSFSLLSLIILLASVAVKLWLSFFNRKLGNRINSSVMKATATDALGDVITTAATIFSILFYHFTEINIDGYVGLLVSLVVMWAGIGIAGDTLNTLIGQAADPEFCRKISEFVESYDGIYGSHDLEVHSYGPSKTLASIHVEVPDDSNIREIHEIVDRIERDVFKQFGVTMVIHMDPVATDDLRTNHIRAHVEKVLKGIDPCLTLHDFRMVEDAETDHVNLFFDVVAPYSYKETELIELHLRIIKDISRLNPDFQCVITLDQGDLQTQPQ